VIDFVQITVILLIFITGLVLGSFFNVVICRVPEKKSIVKPRSSCPSCGAVLMPKDLVPVLSFLLQKGKCRYCKNPISPQYPIVELAAGLMFTAIYLKYGISPEFIFAAYLMSILLIVFFIDLKHMIIPNGLVLVGIAGGLAFFAMRFFYNDSILDGEKWYSPLIGIAAVSGFLLLIAVIGMVIYGQDAMGMGDVKIFIPIALFLGFKLSVLTLFLTIFIGGLTGLVLIITKLKKRKSQIPFAPFIVIGTFISLLFGNNIIQWYLGIL
jgi:leader peptidase (prepilin peptidase)/N-methyltransferase